MFFTQSLTAKFLSELGTFRRLFGLFHELVQCAQFVFRVEVQHARRRVVGPKFFAYAAITRARYIASRKVQQTSVVRLADEVHDVHHSINVRRQGVAQVGIEIRQARAVDNEIEMLAKFFVGSERKSQVWLSDVAFHHFDFFPDESRQIQAISRVERIKNWRFLDHLFETVDGWIRFLATD